MLRRLIALFLLAGTPAQAAAPLEQLPEQRYGDILTLLKADATDAARRDHLKEFIERVRMDIASMPDNIDEAQTEKAAEYFEFHTYLKEISFEALTAGKCGQQVHHLVALSNPQALTEEDVTETAHFAISLVKTICKSSR